MSGHGSKPTIQRGSTGKGTVYLALPGKYTWTPAGIKAVCDLMAGAALQAGVPSTPWVITATTVQMTSANGLLDDLAEELWDLVADGNVVP